MATTISNEYDHIDIVAGSNTNRHYFKDRVARNNVDILTAAHAAITDDIILWTDHSSNNHHASHIPIAISAGETVNVHVDYEGGGQVGIYLSVGTSSYPQSTSIGEPGTVSFVASQDYVEVVLWFNNEPSSMCARVWKSDSSTATEKIVDTAVINDNGYYSAQLTAVSQSRPKMIQVPFHVSKGDALCVCVDNVVADGYISHQIAFGNSPSTFVMPTSVYYKGAKRIIAPGTYNYIYVYVNCTSLTSARVSVSRKKFNFATYSVLGDSYSAYEGTIPSGNTKSYPYSGNDVDDPSQMWWRVIGDQNEATLDLNESWSGAPVCNYAYNTSQAEKSFVTRVKNVPASDVIFVFGGTNDDWGDSELGDYVYSGWTTEQLNQFRPALAYVLNWLLVNRPTSKTIVILNDVLASDYKDSMLAIAAHYNIDTVELTGINKISSHPTKAGMMEIGGQIARKLMMLTETSGEYDGQLTAVGEKLENVVGNTEEIGNDLETLTSRALDAYPSSNAGPSSIVTITDGADGTPLKDLKVNIEPVQDLHGYSKPWPAGGGKNLVGLNTSPDGAITYSNVTATDHTDNGVKLTSTSNTYANMRLNYTLPAGTYTAQYQATSSDSFTPTVSIYKTSGDVLLTSGIVPGTPKTFTLSDTTAINIRFFVTGSTAEVRTVTITQFMLESGSTATTYSPYSNICPISGHDSVTVTRCGKNVLPGLITGKTLDNDTGAETSGTSNTITDYIPVLPGQSYVLSSVSSASGAVRVFEYDAYKNYISNSQLEDFANNKMTITAGANTHFIRLRSGSAVLVSGNNYQIEKGSTATAYEPYQAQTIPVNLSTVTGGTVYGGELDITAGTLTVNKAIVDMGTLSWSMAEAFNSIFRADVPLKANGIGNIICSDYYVNTASHSPILDKSIVGYASDNRVLLRDTSFSINTDMSTALSGVMLCYELAEPVTYTLTPQEIDVLSGTNNIWSDAGDITVVYRVNTATYVDKKVPKNIKDGTGTGSVAEGGASATGSYSHAEGASIWNYDPITGTTVKDSPTASGSGSSVTGNATKASGSYSRAEGNKTIANHRSQHVFGEFNEADTSSAAATARGNYVEIVGNGASDNARSNARTLDWSGNEELAGDLTIKKGVTGEKSMSALVTEVGALQTSVGNTPMGTEATTITGAIKEHGDDLGNLLSAVVNKNGIGEVTPQNLQIVDAEISPNLMNMDAITDGYYISKDGVSHSNSNYFVTDYILVDEQADYTGKYTFTNATTGNKSRLNMGLRYVACYNSNKEIMTSSGSDTNIDADPYTVPTGVAFIRFSIYKAETNTEYQFEKGSTATDYSAYGTLLSAVIKDEYLPDEPVDMGDVPAFGLVDGQNLFNTSDPDYLTGKYIKRDGTTGDSANYVTTGFIPVQPGERLIGGYKAGTGATGPATLVYLAAYNSSKTAVVNSGVSAGSSNIYDVPSGIYYVRISINANSVGQYIQIEKSDSNYPRPYVPYEEPHYELKESYMFPFPNAPENVYLPSDIYVAVGRTIELYNSQIVLDYEKYHFRWVCGKGNAYARKFSITGDSAGNQNLDLYLYDDKKNLCWIGRCVIHIVAASNPTKKIMPIGDSLTNWKPWLQETMLLSENHITWLGTRYSGACEDSEGNEYPSGTIHHEGRSGWKASDYLSNATYDFDNRYDGVGTVAGTANPFWDGTKFSLSHYLSVQTGVSTPDAVQIFLGTNDVRNGIESASENIVAMVQTIRTEYPSMPIFVCNTIYNANQNGYGSVGSDAYESSSGANAWQYEQDCLVMDLMKSLRTALAAYTGVYIIPLASCMDREYDFGQVMTKVNPRSNVEVAMPVERIHPQAPGYYQMADLMYSFYCGVLN